MQKPVKPEKKLKGDLIREQIFAKKEELAKLSKELDYEGLKNSTTVAQKQLDAMYRAHRDVCKNVARSFSADEGHSLQDYYGHDKRNTRTSNWSVHSVKDEFKAAVEQAIGATADEIKLFSPCAGFDGIVASIANYIINNDPAVVAAFDAWKSESLKFDETTKKENAAQFQLGIISREIRVLEEQFCTWERRRKAQTGELKREGEEQRRKWDEEENARRRHNDERNHKEELAHALREAERAEKLKSLDYAKVGNSLGILNELAMGTRKLEWPPK